MRINNNHRETRASLLRVLFDQSIPQALQAGWQHEYQLVARYFQFTKTGSLGA